MNYNRWVFAVLLALMLVGMIGIASIAQGNEFGSTTTTNTTHTVDGKCPTYYLNAICQTITNSTTSESPPNAELRQLNQSSTPTVVGTAQPIPSPDYTIPLTILAVLVIALAVLAFYRKRTK